MGMVRQKLEGTGTAFLGATGTIVVSRFSIVCFVASFYVHFTNSHLFIVLQQKVLKEGEVLVVDTNCLLAYSDSCTFDLKRAGGIVGMFGGGEGIFNSTITGPGLAIVQSMNKQLLLNSLAAEKLYRR
jgi:uncharacterized protein (AIM24 family)